MAKSWELTTEQKRKVELEQQQRLIEQHGEKRDSTIEEVIEGYKKLIQALGGNFLEFAEVYNKVLQAAKKYGFIESTLTARIKDFSSSNTNSDNKELDDMFGMEIATPTELEKEVLILFNELIFKNSKTKIWKKTEELGGYEAYHSTGILDIKNDENLREKMLSVINNTLSEEWTSPKDREKEPQDRRKVSPFKNLQEYIKNPLKLNLLVSTMKKMLDVVKQSNINFDEVPIIEFHFLTIEKQREAIIGKAAHSKYKSGIEEKVQQLFNEEKLFRGINAPWKFEADKYGLELQDFYDTLAQNWPFLEDSIRKRLHEGNGENAIKMSREFDEQLASQFTFLREYIDGEVCEDPYKQAEIWGQLKTLIMHYRLDMRGEKQSLAREVLNIPIKEEGERK